MVLEAPRVWAIRMTLRNLWLYGVMDINCGYRGLMEPRIAGSLTISSSSLLLIVRAMGITDIMFEKCAGIQIPGSRLLNHTGWLR